MRTALTFSAISFAALALMTTAVAPAVLLNWTSVLAEKADMRAEVVLRR